MIYRWVIEAIKVYLEIIGKDVNAMYNYSPFEIRQLLWKVLNVREWADEEQ
jgi:hypothetical protein